MSGSLSYVAPLWSDRCKASKIVNVLRNQYDRPTVHKMLGLKNIAYVSWIERNCAYGGKSIPNSALSQTFAYYEQHKNEPPLRTLKI